jgi:RNA polymerase sigma-70 factor (ECF subfamily)
MGSRESRLERLARENSTEVANYLRRRLYPLSASDLDDLVEEVLLVVWRRIDAVPADAELAWMIGVARNVLNNARRRQNSRDAYIAAIRPPGDDASAEEYVVADVTVREALSGLAEADREVILLHFWDGLDAAALASVFSITTNAAAVRLSRAQNRFRVLMGAQEAIES